MHSKRPEPTPTPTPKLSSLEPERHHPQLHPHSSRPTPPSFSCASLEPAVKLRVEIALEAEEAPGRRAIEQARSELEGAQRGAADAEENANRAQAELSQAARTLPPQPALPPSPARHLSHSQCLPHLPSPIALPPPHPPTLPPPPSFFGRCASRSRRTSPSWPARGMR